MMVLDINDGTPLLFSRRGHIKSALKDFIVEWLWGESGE
jgi:hypothetical protein